MIQDFCWLLLTVSKYFRAPVFTCLEWPSWQVLINWGNHFALCVKHTIMCCFSFCLYNPFSLSLSPSCLPSSGTTQSQSLTSVPIVPSLLPTLATWPNMSASTLEWNPTPAPTAKRASDSSVTFSSTTGKWLTGLGFLIFLSVFLRSG